MAVEEAQGRGEGGGLHKLFSISFQGTLLQEQASRQHCDGGFGCQHATHGQRNGHGEEAKGKRGWGEGRRGSCTAL